MQVATDIRSTRGWAVLDGLSFSVKTPGADARAAPSEYVAPGRTRATVPDDGAVLYTFMVSTPLGTERLLHLPRKLGEDEAWGTNPALETWRSAGLVGNWDPSALAQRRKAARASHQPDRWLIGLALVLFLAGVVADRTKVAQRP
jgi:hypothetical protein